MIYIKRYSVVKEMVLMLHTIRITINRVAENHK